MISVITSEGGRKWELYQGLLRNNSWSSFLRRYSLADLRGGSVYEGYRSASRLGIDEKQINFTRIRFKKYISGSLVKDRMSLWRWSWFWQTIYIVRSGWRFHSPNMGSARTGGIYRKYVSYLNRINERFRYGTVAYVAVSFGYSV